MSDTAVRASDRLPWPANPASLAAGEGCPLWQQTSDADDTPMCDITIVALVGGVPACGWCLDACARAWA